MNKGETAEVMKLMAQQAEFAAIGEIAVYFLKCLIKKNCLDNGDNLVANTIVKRFNSLLGERAIK